MLLSQQLQFHRGEVATPGVREPNKGDFTRDWLIPQHAVAMARHADVAPRVVDGSDFPVPTFQEMDGRILVCLILSARRTLAANSDADPIANRRLPRFPIVVAHGVDFTGSSEVAA